jgi:glutaredoxin 3
MVLAAVAAAAHRTWGILRGSVEDPRNAVAVAAPVDGVRAGSPEPYEAPSPEPVPMPEARPGLKLDPSAEAQVRRFWRTTAPGSASRAEPAAGGTAPLAQASTSATSGERSSAASANVHIVVYTTAWCPVCKRAKAWMRGQGIAFEERDVEASTINAREMRTINPRGGVPTFNVEGYVLVGFDPNQVMSSIRRAGEQRRM